MDYSLPGSSVDEILQGKNTGVDYHPSPPPGGVFLTQGSGDVSCVFCIAGGFFAADPPG